MATRQNLPDFDGRPTVRFVNTTPEHPMIIGLSDAAFRLWFDAVCYSSRAESDGKVSDAWLRKQRPPKIIRELADSGRIEPAGADWVVHDYLHYNRAASEIQSFREAKSAGGQLGNHKRWHVPNRKIVKDCPYCLKEVESA